MPKQDVASIRVIEKKIICSGSWTVHTIAYIDSHYKVLLKSVPRSTIIDAATISTMDTAGAWLLHKVIIYLDARNINVTEQLLKPQHTKLVAIIKKSAQEVGEIHPPKLPNRLARIGMWVSSYFGDIIYWLHFTGELVYAALRILRRPGLFKWNYFCGILYRSGYRALPIIAFLSLLIGVVITYQIGLELKLYGANIFIVNLLGLAIFREFAPLITAIIIAGRTASAFTAQLGVMKANEELDALRTMGLSPIDMLIMPRILALLIAMPLLTVWADIFGILGGMTMSKSILGISYYGFLERFPENVTLTSFTIGLVKAPVFGMIIAGVGCFQGMQVKGSSESVGWQTTKSVVLSIFLIIIADAIFSVLLSWAKI